MPALGVDGVQLWQQRMLWGGFVVMELLCILIMMLLQESIHFLKSVELDTTKKQIWLFLLLT